MFQIQRRSIKALLLFFVIAVLMIGFPAVSKIKFDKDGLEIDKATQALAENPSNLSAKTKLESLVAQRYSIESFYGLINSKLGAGFIDSSPD